MATELLTTREAANLLGIDPSSVRRLRLRGLLKGKKKQGNIILFTREAVEKARERPSVGNPGFKRKSD